MSTAAPRPALLFLLATSVCAVFAGCYHYGPPPKQKRGILFSSRKSLNEIIEVDLRSPDPDVRRFGVLALGQRGEREELVVPLLGKRLSPDVEPAELVSAAAAVSLRALGTPEAARQLEQHLEANRLRPGVQRDIVKSLGLLARSSSAKPLRAVLSDPLTGPDIRIEAVHAVARVEKRGALPLLIRTLTDSNASVRFAAHEELSRLTGQSLPAARTLWEDWYRKQDG